MSISGLKRARGFSMVEMLIVLAIMGIMGTMSVSYMLAAKPHAELERAQLELIGRLNGARQLAVSEEVQTRLRFDTTVTPQEYWIQRYNVATSTWSNDSHYPLYELPTGVTVSANTFSSAMVRFNTRGALQSSGTITLRSSTGETSPLTGNLASGRFQFGAGNTR